MYTITKILSPSFISYAILSHNHQGCIELTRTASFPDLDSFYYAKRYLNTITSYSTDASLLDILVTFGITESEIAYLFSVSQNFDTYIKQFGTWTLLEQVADE